MRIEIPTNGKPVKDPEIKGLYVLDKAMQMISDKMLKASLDYCIDKYHKKIFGK